MKRAALVFLILVTGCTVGPDYQTPSVALPEKFEEDSLLIENEERLATFWKQFQDEQLDGYVDRALQSNFDLRITLEHIEEARAFYRIERSRLYPQILMDADAVRSRRSANFSSNVIEDPATLTEATDVNFSGPLVQSFYQLGLVANWELDLFGKLRRSKEAAHYEFEASQEEALSVRVALLAEVVSIYMQIRGGEESVNLFRKQIERQSDLLALAENLLAAGLVSHIETVTLRKELEELKSQLPLLENRLKQAIYSLALLLAEEPEKFVREFSMEGRLPKKHDAIPVGLTSTLLRRRPDIRLAEKKLAAATARIGVAKGALFPTFSLNGGGGMQSNSLRTLFELPSRFWEIGGNMIWMLFDGGRLIAELKISNTRQRQALLIYERAIMAGLRDVEGSLLLYYKEKERLDQLTDKVWSDQELNHFALERYHSGLTSFSEVLATERALFQTEQERTDSHERLMIYLAAVYRALGGGWGAE